MNGRGRGLMDRALYLRVAGAVALHYAAFL
jgi:hypothetical protein